MVQSSSFALLILVVSLAATSCSSDTSGDSGLRSLQSTRNLNNLRSCSFAEVQKQAQRRGVQLTTSEEEVEAMCVAAAEARAGGFKTIAQALEKTDEFVKEFFVGGTDWNMKTEDGEGNYRLKDTGAIIDQSQDNIVDKQPLDASNIQWLNQCLPTGAAMCCWNRDRQANDNNGNCNRPYEENCIDRDPADNNDICFSDFSRSPRGRMNSKLHQANFSMMMTGANGDATGPPIAIFADETEGDTHCHGFAWPAGDESSQEWRLRGNLLYYVSLYDHLYTRGYAEALPGSPMCGCVDEMVTVSRADCTEPDVDERFNVVIVGGEVQSIEQTRMEIDFNACTGRTNNDLVSYVKKIDPENRDNLRPFLTGPSQNNQGQSQCPQTIRAAQAVAAAQEVGDNYYFDRQLGEWGGVCRCPSGAEYEVGDAMNACTDFSSTCVGGEMISGGTVLTCERRRGNDKLGSRMAVICGGSAQSSVRTMSYGQEAPKLGGGLTDGAAAQPAGPTVVLMGPM